MVLKAKNLCWKQGNKKILDKINKVFFYFILNKKIRHNFFRLHKYFSGAE